MADCTEIQTRIDLETAVLTDLKKPGYCERQFPIDPENPDPEVLNDRKLCHNSLNAKIADEEAVINALSNELELCIGFVGLWYWCTLTHDDLGFTYLAHQTLQIMPPYPVESPGLWSGILTTTVVGAVEVPPPETINFGTIDLTTLQMQFISGSGRNFSGQFNSVSIIGAITNSGDGTLISSWDASHDPNHCK